jgi:hypothetical protein
MRRKALVLTLFLLVVCGLATVAIASVPASRRQNATAADQIRAQERALLTAMVNADRAATGRLLAPDFQLIDPFGAPESRTAYLDTVGGGVDFIVVKPVSTIKVRPYGNTAVARFQAAFEVVAGPDRLKHRAWTTDIFERRNGRWLLVWSQTTPTPNNPDLLVQALKAR